MGDLLAETYTGGAATCHEIFKHTLKVPEGATASSQACVAQWLVLAPQQHSIWPHYILFVTHLRDIEGQEQPPQRKDPNNSHNLMLAALNPRYAPWTVDRFREVFGGFRLEHPDIPGSKESPLLNPINLSLFVDGLMDAQAEALCKLVALGISSGTLVCEPDDFRGGHGIWEWVVQQTAKSIRAGDERLVVPSGPQRVM